MYAFFAWCLVCSTGIRTGQDLGMSVQMTVNSMHMANHTSEQQNRTELALQFPTLPRGVCQSDLAVTDFYTYSRLNDKLGQGAFGAVYRGTSDTGQVVAIKDILETSKFRPLEIEPSSYGLPFNSEIIEVFQPGLKKIQLVYELYDGGDLDNYLKKTVTGLDAATVHNVASQLAYGLWRLHLQGFVHRDLKPANIMIKGAKLVIGDYGLVSAGCSSAKPRCSSGSSGTPSYFGPAQWRGSVAYGPEVDWHAFAVIVYKLVVGRNGHPFGYHSSLETLQSAVLGRNPKLSAILNPQLTALLKSLLSREIDDFRGAEWFSGDVSRHPVLKHAYWLSAGSGVGMKDHSQFWSQRCSKFYPAEVCDVAYSPQKTALCKHRLHVPPSTKPATFALPTTEAKPPRQAPYRPVAEDKPSKPAHRPLPPTPVIDPPARLGYRQVKEPDRPARTPSKPVADEVRRAAIAVAEEGVRRPLPGNYERQPSKPFDAKHEPFDKLVDRLQLAPPALKRPSDNLPVRGGRAEPDKGKSPYDQPVVRDVRDRPTTWRRPKPDTGVADRAFFGVDRKPSNPVPRGTSPGFVNVNRDWRKPRSLLENNEMVENMEETSVLASSVQNHPDQNKTGLEDVDGVTVYEDEDVYEDIARDLVEHVLVVTVQEIEERRERQRQRTQHIDDVIEQYCDGIDKLLGFTDYMGNWVFEGDSEFRVGLESSNEGVAFVESREIGFQKSDPPPDAASVEDICSVVVTMYKDKPLAQGSSLETKSNSFELQCRTKGEDLVCGRVTEDGNVVPQPYVYNLAEGESIHKGSLEMQRQIVMSLAYMERDMDELSSMTSSIQEGSILQQDWVLHVAESPVGSDIRFGEWNADFLLEKIPLSGPGEVAFG